MATIPGRRTLLTLGREERALARQWGTPPAIETEGDDGPWYPSARNCVLAFCIGFLLSIPLLVTAHAWGWL